MVKRYKTMHEVQAIQFTGENLREINGFCGKSILSATFEYVKLKGEYVCFKNDYIVKGLYGEFYACKSDVFKQTHSELVDEGTPESADNPLAAEEFKIKAIISSCANSKTDVFKRYNTRLSMDSSLPSTKTS